MGRLILVRHAQASFLEQNYDKLSALGETQARLLGEYWAKCNVIFDRVYTGPRVRQKDTAKLMSDQYRKSASKSPTPVVLPEFDEYQAEAVVERGLPQLLETSAGIRELHGAFQTSASSRERPRDFQRLFAAVTAEWVRGTIPLPGVEPWPEFCSRVNLGLSKIMANGGRGEQVAIVTSGGPIAVAMQRALNLSPQHSLQVSWMSRNCSWSEFLYTGDRFTLSTFKTHPHLNDPATLTHR
jgi:broad specificity phosphatase PhoE